MAYNSLGEGKISYCTNYATVVGSSEAGGILGSSGTMYIPEISNCENFGTIIGEYAGGILGYYYDMSRLIPDPNILVPGCKNYGVISPDRTPFSDLIGFFHDDS